MCPSGFDSRFGDTMTADERLSGFGNRAKAIKVENVVRGVAVFVGKVAVLTLALVALIMFADRK